MYCCCSTTAAAVGHTLLEYLEVYYTTWYRQYVPCCAKPTDDFHQLVTTSPPVDRLQVMLL